MPRGRLGFYLFLDAKDYFAAGGILGSVGCYKADKSGARLMAMAPGGANPQLWKIVQHEGFHQFAHQVEFEWVG